MNASDLVEMFYGVRITRVARSTKYRYLAHWGVRAYTKNCKTLVFESPKFCLRQCFMQGKVVLELDVMMIVLAK